jgi:hypothetical protein
MAVQYHKYTITDLYRGVNIIKICYSSSSKIAMKMLDSTPARWKVSAISYPVVNIKFQDVRATIASGELLSKRPDLQRVELPLNELYTIIDAFIDDKYSHLITTGHTMN